MEHLRVDIISIAVTGSKSINFVSFVTAFGAVAFESFSTTSEQNLFVSKLLVARTCHSNLLHKEAVDRNGCEEIAGLESNLNPSIS